MRDSQYAEAMVSNYINANTNTGNVLAKNMGQGKMAYISRDDCAIAAAYAAMSDWADRVRRQWGRAFDHRRIHRDRQSGHRPSGQLR